MRRFTQCTKWRLTAWARFRPIRGKALHLCPSPQDPEHAVPHVAGDGGRRGRRRLDLERDRGAAGLTWLTRNSVSEGTQGLDDHDHDATQTTNGNVHALNDNFLG
jgi:hypothetical protein